MANCTNSEVRYICSTGLDDTQLTALIVLADAEMSDRGITSTNYSAGTLKQVSMLITASLAAMNEITTYGKSDYSSTGESMPKYYRKLAEDLIVRGGELPLYVWNEPLPDEE